MAFKLPLPKRYLSFFLSLLALFAVMVSNFYYLHSELEDFYNLVVEEERSRVKSVLEGTLSAGGDPVEALSYYLSHSHLLKGATIFVGGREVVIPGSELSSSYYQETIEIKPFKFKLFIDSYYLQELNKHIKVIFVSLLFFSLLFSLVLFLTVREYYSEKLLLEKEHREKERLKTINLVIHSILHEVKNRLNALSLLLYRFERSGSPSYLKALKRELSLLNSYIEESSHLRRPLKLNVREFTVSELVRALESKVSPLLDSSGVTFKLKFQEASLRGDFEKLLSALVDLLKNGLEAVREEEVKEVELVGRKEGSYYTFKVVDSGTKPLPRELFKPFSSSKEKGFGLGLFNVKRIVEAHGGSVCAYKDSGRTVFELKLPLSEKFPS